MGSDTPTSVKPLPALPQRQHSFTSWQTQNPTAPPPGNWLDSELNQAQTTLKATIDWASVSLRSDGSLNPAAVTKALNGSATNGIDNSANDTALAEAVAMDYAVLSQAWAEYMPDTIPPNILASNDITGDHWSSRWWATQAANFWVQTGHALTDDLYGTDGNQDLLVKGNAVIEGSLTAGELTVGGDAAVHGDFAAAGDLAVGGAAVITGDVVAADLTAEGGVWAGGVGSDFGFDSEPPNNTWHWGKSGYEDFLDTDTGTRFWRTDGGNVMSLTNGSVLTVTGSINTPAFTADHVSVTHDLAVGGTVAAAAANVSGAVHVGGAVIAGTDTSSFAGALLAASLGVSGSATVSNLGVTGNAAVSGRLGAGTLAVGGETDIHDLGVTGAVVVTGNVSAASATITNNLQADRLISNNGVFANFQSGLSGTIPFGFFYAQSHYIFNWGVANCYEYLNPVDAVHHWVTPGGEAMNLTSAGNLAVIGTISSGLELHAGATGIFYSGLFNDHSIGFHFTGTQLVGYVDGNSIGPLVMTSEVQALRERVVSLEARIVALEAARA